MKDAQKLGEIYLTLLEQSADLFIIMERHPDLIQVKEHLHDAIQKLSKIAHEIHEDAYELKKEEDNEKEIQ